ncbi:MAG: hypothetical protein UZ22_OP11002000333 [Microgenomates bacterium OLB23]|nr:MAG: hypothetical protein UZ22_OP11002000333 [Microgenomates bacterium OLB23]
MVRNIIFASVFVIILLTFPAHTQAIFGTQIDIGRSLPMVNCGVAGSVSNPKAAQCCYFAPITSIKKAPWILENLPGLGLIPIFPNPFKFWNNTRENILELQASTAAKAPCVVGVPKPEGISPADPSCRCVERADPSRDNLMALCTERFDPDRRGEGLSFSSAEIARIEREREQCIKCGSENGYYSSIGCVRFDVADFMTKWVFGLGVSIAGLFALGCIIVAAIKMQLSQGQAETVQQSRENMTSCILGLLLIIFSVFILNFVGITILPGLLF